MIRSVLLIDDESDFTELAGTLLGFHGFDVETLNDSLQVEKRISDKKFDIIVTDLMMPDLDGFHLIQKVRAMSAYATVPFIALSAKTLSDKERKILLQNKVHFMMKPFEPQGLVEQIHQLLD